ncbi:unnamed protein product [Somion occarium]|uniref:Uncharacterized protein n=1 Tax=Somion occarium TaxID=3059160 RepID=A0ABP1CTZ5_9APHY
MQSQRISRFAFHQLTPYHQGLRSLPRGYHKLKPLNGGTNPRLRLPTELVYPILLDVLLEYFDELFTVAGGVIHSDGSIWTTRLTSNPVTPFLVVSYQFRAITVEILTRILGVRPSLGERLLISHKLLWRHLAPLLTFLRRMRQGNYILAVIPWEWLRAHGTSFINYYLLDATIEKGCRSVSQQPWMMPTQDREYPAVWRSCLILVDRAPLFYRERYRKRCARALWDWFQVRHFVTHRSGAIRLFNTLNRTGALFRSRGMQLPEAFVEKVSEEICDHLKFLDPHHGALRAEHLRIREQFGYFDDEASQQVFKSYMNSRQYAECDKHARKIIYHWSLEGPTFADVLLDIYAPPADLDH